LQVIEGYGKADEGTEEFRAAFKALKPLFKKVFDNFDTKVPIYLINICTLFCLMSLGIVLHAAH
jgi:hypothetical protein